MTRARVLMVVNDATFFLSHRLPLALGARDAGFDVHVATPADDVSPRIIAAGLPFHPIPVTRRGTSPLDEAKAVGALIALYRDFAPDLVHHVSAKPILYGGIAARATRVPAVVHAVSGLGYVFISNRPRARVLRQTIRTAYRVATSHPNCAIIFQNDDDRRTLGSAIGRARPVLIPGSGVDLATFRAAPLPEGVPLVVVPSRMLWDKGIGEVVEAARLLRERRVNVKIALVGGVDLRNPAGIARETLDGWVREGLVEWWGSRTDMPDVLARSTIVCLPSYREGMPKSLLEGVVVGRPILTTDVPGCRDVLTGGDYGVLVPPKDGAAIARAIEELVGDRARLERMASSAQKASSRFAFEKVLESTVDLYRSLLARSRGN